MDHSSTYFILWFSTDLNAFIKQADLGPRTLHDRDPVLL